jgi:hypothetical protein
MGKAVVVIGLGHVGLPLAQTASPARAGEGFDRTAFTVGWNTSRFTCPTGQTSEVIPFEPARAPGGGCRSGRQSRQGDSA